jgi:guanine deaminase
MDEGELLTEALRLATENAAAGQLPFGALVVRAGDIVATGVNTALRDHDPTAHAEVAAIRAACRTLGTLHLGGALVVSSCEPCAVCHGVAAVVGIERIIYAAPKELVPGFDPTDLLGRMQASLRALAPEQIVHVPTDGAERPFTT